MLKAGNSYKKFLSIIRQENHSVCSDPDGRYLYHFTPDKCPKSVKPAEVIANNLVSFMKYKGIDKTLQAIGGDSTNVITGWEGGTMHWVKVKLKRKLNWLICALHANEVPLHHLIAVADLGGPQGPGPPLTKIFKKNKTVKFDKNWFKPIRGLDSAAVSDRGMTF